MNILTPVMLQQARSAQESIMLSTLRITAPADGWELVDGIERPKRGEIIYHGEGRLQERGTSGGHQFAGHVPLDVAPYVGAVPWTITDLEPGCIVDVTDSTDPAHAGVWFRLTHVERNGITLTARRFFAELAVDIRPVT